MTMHANVRLDGGALIAACVHAIIIPLPFSRMVAAAMVTARMMAHACALTDGPWKIAAALAALMTAISKVPAKTESVSVNVAGRARPVTSPSVKTNAMQIRVVDAAIKVLAFVMTASVASTAAQSNVQMIAMAMANAKMVFVTARTAGAATVVAMNCAQINVMDTVCAKTMRARAF